MGVNENPRVEIRWPNARRLFAGTVAFFGHAAEPFTAEDSAFFTEKIQPLLEQRCYECHSHGAKKLKAGLFLDSLGGALQGGDSGPALVPGKPDESRLIKAVRYDDVELEMPPKSKLADAEIALLEDWVRRGAPWSESKAAARSAAGAGANKEFNLAERRKNHWAWQPVKVVPPPQVQASAWPAQPSDNFILSKLEAAKLAPAREADRRTLLRRLSFTLTGLPPTPEEVRAFKGDLSKDAYAKLVDRLLDSPRFSERWARHWLDIVRYSETLGHEFDYPVPNAWRYRDYVIRAINQDVPYDQFIREHLAGDLMEEPRRDPATGLNESALATGFFFFGQQVHSPVDIKGNQLDLMDNQIDTVTRGFQAVTVSCARCHDHKFDAISTKDFYALYGVLASSRYAQAEIGNRDIAAREVKELVRQRDELVRSLNGSSRGNEALTSNPKTGGLNSEVRDPRPQTQDPSPGLGQSLLTSAATNGWFCSGGAMDGSQVQPGALLFLGATNPVVRTTAPMISSRKLSRWLHGAARSPNFTITNRYLHVLAAGQGTRAKVIIENFQMIQDPIYGSLRRVINNAEPAWITFDLAMWAGHRAYLEVLDDPTPDLAGAAGSGLTADGWFDLVDVITSDESKAPQREKLFEVVELPPAVREQLAAIDERAKAIAAESAAAPVLADSEGIDQLVLIRGGPSKPGEPVARRYLEALGGLDHPVQQGSGRDVIADLIASPDNPLTARVWVNRVWHHLFGRGLVATVDDFGVLGEKPSHPELLDWLAHWFVTEGEWSTKKLITLLVTSSTWKQSAFAADDRSAGLRTGEMAAAKFDQLDPDNVLLHKWTVRRLEGEAIRDSLLAVSGRLDLEPPAGSVATHLTSFMTGRGRPGQSGPLDGDGKRSIYLEVRRNFMSPMMLAFDTPQAAQTFGRRARSNVPAQALILMNDPFVQQQAKQFAERMLKARGGHAASSHEQEAGLSDETTPSGLRELKRPGGRAPEAETVERIRWLYAQALQREPTAHELAAALEFLGMHGTQPSAEAWADLCHVLFNTKEFVFVN